MKPQFLIGALKLDIGFVHEPRGRAITFTPANPLRPLSLGYDLGNNLTSEYDLTSGSIGYTRSPAGEVTSITNNTFQGVGNPPNLVSNVSNTPFGPAVYTLANGLQTVQTCDTLGRNSGGWVCNGSCQANCANGTQLYGNTVGWSGGNMTNDCDTVENQCQNHGYDEFNRLTSTVAVAGASAPQGSYTFSYDRWGNRLSQTSSSGGPSPNAAVDPATNRIVGYSYDAAGNLMSDGLSHSFTYDAEGNVVQVNGGSSGSYVYNALNQRVSVQTSSGTLEYLFDPFGRRTSTWLTTRNFGIEGRIYWDRKQIAYRGQSGPTWFEHKSILGTERLRTSYQGTAAATESSLAFGDGFKQNVLIAGGDQDNAQYAGQDYDAESSSQHAKFRQYSSTVGRWMSPDPYDGSYDARNPQSLNRYTYVLNNPFGLTDPLGLGPQDCENPGDPACAPGPTPDCTPNCVDQYGHPYIPNGNGGIAGGNGGEVYVNGGDANPIDISIVSAEGGGAGAGAPNNVPTVKHCHGVAGGKNGVALALDAGSLGADAFGPEAQYAKLGIGLTLSTASMINSAGHQDMTGTGLGMNSYLRAPTELAATSAGWGWAKWIPFAGAVADVYSAYHDGSQAYSDYSSCMAGH